MIEIFSDVACPWCYIGKRRFDAALARLPPGKRPELCWRAFQLMPEYPMGQSEPARPMLERRFGGAAHFQAAFAQVRALATAENIDLSLDAQIACNTRVAHRAIAYAQTHGLASEAAESLFCGFFSEGKNLSDPRDVAACLRRIGISLDDDALLAALSDPRLERSVEQDLLRGAQFGVRGVPFFVADEQYVVSGAQSIDTFVSFLERASSSNA